MPTYLEKYNANIIAFNQKYNLHFDADAFYRKGRESGWNSAYWHTYSDLATALVNNKLAGESSPSLHDMMNDYEEMLMSPYRMHRIGEGKHVAEVYGGINDQKGRTLMVKNAIENKLVYDYQFIAKKYMNGELRIRDMVELARNETSKEGALRNDNAVEIVKYALALEYANTHRPKFWWLFHPFRNHAEQRDSALIRRLVSDKMIIGFDLVLDKARNEAIPAFEKDVKAINYQLKNESSVNENEIKEYNFANEVFKEEEPIIFDEKEIEKIEINNKFMEKDEIYENANDKDFVDVDELGEAEKAFLGILDKEEVVKQQEQPTNPLARIGYRPSFENMQKESAEFKKLNRDMKAGKITSEAEKEIIKVNYDRHVKAYSNSASHGAQTAERISLEKEESYLREDNALKERFPEFAPQSKVNLIEDDRVNIEVDLHEDNIIKQDNIIGNDSVKIDPLSIKK